MADLTELFDVMDGGTGPSFEEIGQENGERYWWQSDLCRHLGYAPGGGFDKAVGRAMSAYTSLGLPIYDGFKPSERQTDKGPVADVRLSRFACYLVAMNGDPQKEQVAHAQAYFATWAEAARQVALQFEGVDRVIERDELTDRDKSLNRTAKGAGVVDYALFLNAGYRGLYNANLSTIRIRKGVPDGRTPLDFMGYEELAANTFRITQTEGKIVRERVRGQRQLENTAEAVGRDVRQAIRKIGGTMPEDLPAAEDIKKLKTTMKKTARQMKRSDSKKQLPPGDEPE